MEIHVGEAEAQRKAVTCRGPLSEGGRELGPERVLGPQGCPPPPDPQLLVGPALEFLINGITQSVLWDKTSFSIMVWGVEYIHILFLFMAEHIPQFIYSP